MNRMASLLTAGSLIGLAGLAGVAGAKDVPPVVARIDSVNVANGLTTALPDQPVRVALSGVFAVSATGVQLQQTGHLAVHVQGAVSGEPKIPPGRYRVRVAFRNVTVQTTMKLASMEGSRECVLTEQPSKEQCCEMTIVSYGQPLYVYGRILTGASALSLDGVTVTKVP